jgi:hypothetical protein
MIAKEEIQDKSKGDIISKGIVVLQTGWFVMQCIARRTQGLPITELELVTIAYAALNFVIYWMWLGQAAQRAAGCACLQEIQS